MAGAYYVVDRGYLDFDRLFRFQTGPTTATRYPLPLRRIRYTDPATGPRRVFLTTNFTLPALTIARRYKARWQVELFFKWLKPHLRIPAFYGTSAHAVKT